MKIGSRKFKGMLPLKCFNCDGVFHFDNKVPYKNKESNEEDDSKRKRGSKRVEETKINFSRNVSAPRKKNH
jgi:hypothetical protein